MKFDFLKNKVFIISFIVLILFSFFNCNVFADSSFDSSFDYLYKFKIDNSVVLRDGLSSSQLQSALDSVSSNDMVRSGDYVYFIVPSWRDYTTFFVKKSSIKDVYVDFWKNEGGSTPNLVWYRFFIDVSDNRDVYFPGSSSYGFNTSSFYGGVTQFLCSVDFDNHFIITNFATNYDNPISFHYQNTDKGSGNFFFVAPTFQLTKAVGQIPEIMTKIIKQVLPIGLIVLGIGLLIYSIRRVIFLMK